MNKKGQLSDEEIRRVVMEILKGQGKGQLEVGDKNKNQLSDEDVNIIKSLF